MLKITVDHRRNGYGTPAIAPATPARVATTLSGCSHGIQAHPGCGAPFAAGAC